MNRTFQGHTAAWAATCRHTCMYAREDSSNSSAAFGLYCVHVLLNLMMCQYEPAHQMGTSSLCSSL